VSWKRILIGSWSWKRPFYSLGTVYLSLALVSFSAGRFFIFHPPAQPYPKSDNFLTIPGDTQIAAYYLPPSSPEKPVILFSHGNAQNIGQLIPLMKDFTAQGYGALAYDYPGYGETPGSPSEESCYAAAQISYHHLTKTLGHHPQQIILCGQSVGTGPTAWLSTQVEHGGVVLISPFLSAFRTVTHIPLLPGDIFPNLKHVKKATTPLLVIHGEEDEVIPYAQGKRIFKESASPTKKFLSIPEAGHNDLFLKAWPKIFKEVAALSKQITPPSS